MAAVDQQLSRAVVIYLGKGRVAWPQPSGDRVRDAFPDVAESLVERVKAVVEQALAVEPGGGDTLSQAGQRLRRQLERDRPELDRAAVDALVWAWTFDRR